MRHAQGWEDRVQVNLEFAILGRVVAVLTLSQDPVTHGLLLTRLERYGKAEGTVTLNGDLLGGFTGTRNRHDFVSWVIEVTGDCQQAGLRVVNVFDLIGPN